MILFSQAMSIVCLGLSLFYTTRDAPQEATHMVALAIYFQVVV